jgi:hypothetical protein
MATTTEAIHSQWNGDNPVEIANNSDDEISKAISYQGDKHKRAADQSHSCQVIHQYIHKDHFNINYM